MDLNKDLIIKEKNKINFPSKIFLDAKFKESVTSERFENISPIHG